MSLVAAVLGHRLVEVVLRLAGLSALAGVTTGLIAFVYRARVRETLPEGPALIIGLGVVAIYLNTRLIFVQFIGETGDPLRIEQALLNILVFAVAGVATYAGRAAGDRLGASKQLTWGRLQPDLSPIVRAAGRTITVTLPRDIDNIEGYDPVQGETKAAIAGQELVFPRGLTVTELQSQVATRLTEKHDTVTPRCPRASNRTNVMRITWSEPRTPSVPSRKPGRTVASARWTLTRRSRNRTWTPRTPRNFWMTRWKTRRPRAPVRFSSPRMRGCMGVRSSPSRARVITTGSAGPRTRWLFPERTPRLTSTSPWTARTA